MGINLDLLSISALHDFWVKFQDPTPGAVMSLLGDIKKGRRVAKQLAEYALYRATLLIAEENPDDELLQQRTLGVEELLNQAFANLPPEVQWERSPPPETRTPVLAGSLYTDPSAAVKPKFI